MTGSSMRSISCLIAVFFVSFLPSAAGAELRLWCEFAGRRLPLAGVEQRQPYCLEDGRKIPVPRTAKWIVEGELRENAHMVLWSPQYNVSRTEIPDCERERLQKSYSAWVTVSHSTERFGEKTESRFLKWYPGGLTSNAVVVLGWMVDGVLVDSTCEVVPSTEVKFFLCTHEFKLTQAEARGQGVALVWSKGGFLAPAARFRSPDAETAFRAIIANDPAGLRAALAAGAKPGASDRDDYSLLAYAAEAGSESCVDVLLQAGAKARGSAAAKALGLACANGRNVVVAKLLAAHASPSLADGGTPPLQMAIRGRHSVVALDLVAAGAKVDEPDGVGVVPLALAIDRGLVDVATALVQRRAEFDAKDNQHARVLITQTRLGHAGSVRFLLDRGAPPDVEYNGQRAIIAGAVAGDPEIARMLLGKGVNPDVAAGTGLSALMVTAAYDRLEYARALLDAGAAVDRALPDGTTALYLAAQSNSAAVVRLLCARGANVSTRINGRTALDIAIEVHAGAAAAALAEAGAKVDVQKPEADARVASAVCYDLAGVLDRAIRDGWKPQSALEGGWTVLALARSFDARRCVELLMAIPGADAAPTPPIDNSVRVQPQAIMTPHDPRDVDDDFPAAEVLVEAIVDRDGKVRFPHVLKASNQALAAPAVRAFGKWNFVPPRNNAHPVAVIVQLPISFPAAKDQVLEAWQLDRTPMPVKRVPIQYPARMREQDRTGMVTLRFVVNLDGRPDHIQVRNSTNPAFEEPAIKALSQWVFKPGELNGTPVVARTEMPIVFTLR